MISYSVIRSDRRTVTIQIKTDGSVVVRAPRRIPDAEIRRIVAGKEQWIMQKLQKAQEYKDAHPVQERFTREEVEALAEKALKVIPERVRIYAPQVGVTYGRITIRNQRTRWGSCSSKGNLNFNCLLMLTPQEVIDSVVVHELCHRKHMDHSKAFYEEVHRVFPEYDKWNRWLKENGPGLIGRL